MPLLSTGGAPLKEGVGRIIRFALHGHANRPFFHIVVQNEKEKRNEQAIEQLGVYDPMPNKENQKLVSLNIERTRYWMGQGATFSPPVAKLLGVVGFLPIHPATIVEAWKNREVIARKEAAAKAAETNTTEIAQPPSSAV